MAASSMPTFPPYFLVLLPLIILASTGVADPPANEPTNVLLNCGESSSVTYSEDNRRWDRDAHSKFSPTNINDVSLASKASTQDPSVTQVPFMTARIFNSTFTYTFPVSAGPKFLRLYFYPATYSGLNMSKSFFSVTAANCTLLSNFSAFLTAAAMKPRQYSLVKEYILNVRDNQRLDVTFVPSPNSHAFINGIEIVYMPNNLYIPSHEKSITFVGSQQPFIINNKTALETLYRLNVGGNDIPGLSDTGMYRKWRDDVSYIYQNYSSLIPGHLNDNSIHYTNGTPPYTAPAIVYSTGRSMSYDSQANLRYNLTWTFPVDSGFGYLVRLHFCEFQLEVTQKNERVFTVFLHNQTADQQVDVIRLSGGNWIPIYRDYVVFLDNGQRKQDLWLALHPNISSSPLFANAILNGLEIFKLNQSNGSLASPNPKLAIDTSDQPQQPQLPATRKSSGSLPVYVIVGTVLGGIAVFSILGFLIFRRRGRVRSSLEKKAKSSWATISNASRSTKTNASLLPSDLCRHFSLTEIKSATRNFNEDLLIGSGGFGNVYKGCLDNGTITVAIKRLNPTSNQGAREFKTEIEMLSKLRHLHLVSLIGYCDEDGEMILVYDYISRGTLRDHLYTMKNPPLSWKQRLQICIGAARGLHYLHTGAKQMIIHRDVKSTNILLDEKWVAKVSDFGLSKMGPTDESKTHVSTVVKGSFGYVDPEYYRRQQLTEKSDVYSFGVVLLEVLCARPAIVLGLPKEQVSLAEWARHCWREGTVDQMVELHLDGKIALGSLRKFWEIVMSCLRESRMERPAMSDVVWGLEFALQLQEAADGAETTLSSPAVSHWEARTTEDDPMFSSSNLKSDETSTAETGGTVSYGPRSDTVFSEIMNPMAR